MQTATKSNLFFTDCSSLNVLANLQTFSGRGEFYQQIVRQVIKGIYTKQAFNSSVERLVAIAEHACYLRRFDVVEQVSRFLLNWPSSQYKDLALYYRALCLSQRRQFNESRALLERLAEKLPPKFRAKALLAMAATCYGSGDFQSALPLSIEASRAADYHNMYDPQTFITSQRNIAIHKGIDGDHRGALADLERLLPLARTISKWHPYSYYEHLNSLAVELGEVGRLEEAQRACRIALTSPYAIAYPEWIETCDELTLKSRKANRSVVAISRKEFQSEDHADEELSREPTSLTTQEQADEPGNKLLLFRRRAFNTQQPPLYSHLEANPNQLTLAQKRSRIVDIACNLPEDALDQLLELANELDDRPAQAHRPREINLEQRGTLEMMMSLWATGDLKLEDHIAVLSSLRDCDNDLRRNNIINSMISYMFRFTQERMESEHFWRKRFEARLTPEED